MKKITIVLLLLSQITLIAQDYKFGKVSKEELQENFYALDSSADAAFLYRKRKTFFKYVQYRGDFQVITEIHERIKIYNKEGFEFANRYISYYKPDSGSEETVNSIKGYTYNINKGKVTKDKLSNKDIFDEKKNKYYGLKKITLPNVKVGSVLEIKYRITSPYKSIDDLEFQYEIPVKKLAYTIEIPEYYIFNIKSKGYYSIPPIKSKENGSLKIRDRGTNYGRGDSKTPFTVTNYFSNVKEFNANDIPALKNNEPFVGSIKSYRGGAEFELSSTDFTSIEGSVKNFSTSWENVSQQIYKSSHFGGELAKSNYYMNELESILSASKTDFEKIGAIFQFVKTKVKWNGFYGKYVDKGVRKAYKEGVGNVADINLMLTSMLRSAGLDANPVLVSSRDNGVPLFPTLKGFNYVISMVEFKDGTYLLLDATEPYSLPNTLPVRSLNWNGRKVTKKGNSTWVKLASTKPAIEDNNLMVKITDDLMVEGFIRTKFSNLYALNYRNNNNHIKEESIISKFEETNNVEVESFKITNANQLNKPIVRSIKFNSEDLIEEINEKLYIEPLLFLSKHNNPFKLEERKFPVDFTTPWKNKNTVLIQIPEGYKVETLPASFAISLPDNLGVFKYQAIQTGNKIKLIVILQFNSAIIAAGNYKVLKEFYGGLVKKQSEKIVLVKE